MDSWEEKDKSSLILDGWLNLRALKVMRHILNSILALRGSQCSSISEEVVGNLGGRLNISLAALFTTDSPFLADSREPDE